MNYIKSFLIALPVLMALDMGWFLLLMGKFYQTRLHDLLRFGSDGSLALKLLPAFFVYLLMTVLVLVFAVPKGISGGAMQGFLWGALLGWLIYGFYNFTNYGLFEKYDLVVATIDTLWGGVIFGLTTLLVVLFI